MAGNNLFTLDPWNRLYRYDLQSGVPTHLTQFNSATALGADDTSVWVVANGTLQRLSFTGTLLAQRALPYGLTGSMLAVGDNLYATDSSGTSVVQLRKDQPLHTAVAGDTALDGLLLTSLTGVASDGNRLHLADNHGLNSVTKAVRTYKSAPQEPKITTAVASPATPLGSVNTGAATVGDFTYTGKGNQVVRTDTRTGTTTLLAGSGSTGCTDAALGNDATFTTPTIVGADQNLVYVADCGLRTINVSNGATRRLPNAPAGSRYTMANHTIFVSDSWARLYQYDLQTGSTSYLTSTGSVSAMAADDESVWIASGQTLTRYAAGTGAATTISTQMPALADGIMTSVGGYLCVKAARAVSNGPAQAVLTAISKIDGMVSDVAVGGADGSPFNPLSGMVSALTYANNALIAVVFETDDEGIIAPVLRTMGILGFKVNPYAYIDFGTLFVPSNNVAGSESIYLPWRLFWNPQTRLCDYGNSDCSAIYAWRQAEFEAEGGDSFFHKLKCTVVVLCMPEDLERELLSQVVNEQGVYDFPFGILRNEWKREFAEDVCAQSTANPETTCTDENLQAVADTATTVIQILAYYGGRIGPQTLEHQTAMTRLQQLATLACQSVFIWSGAHNFGDQAHEVFWELVEQEQARPGGNPKFWSETGYSSAGVVDRYANGPRSVPDFVYGTTRATPEFIVDFKSGLTGIRGKWYRKLVNNLPLGFKNVPVYKVTCAPPTSEAARRRSKAITAGRTPVRLQFRNISRRGPGPR